MKQRILVLTLALAVLSITGMAQRPQGAGERPQWNAEQRAEQMAKDLELTKEQQTQVKELFEKQQAEMAEIRKQPRNEGTDRRAQFSELRKKWDTELEKIIGSEKLAKHKELQAQRMNNRRNRQQ
ncbi:MAG: hypothetical protein PHU68_06250 [Paludibacter sp.]|nr:hypothetical protein [Paludibacter sp.]